MPHAASASQPVGSAVTLPARGLHALSVQAALLVSASFLLPAGAHLLHLPVRWLLPMHWPVVLVGLCYGWRSGAVVGMAAPALSFLLSGMPRPEILPAMTVELAAYGLLAGWLRQSLRWNAFAAAGLALLGGRLVFVVLAWATGAAVPALLPYVERALVPGLIAAVGQLLLLPLVAGWWVRRRQRP
jgi:hypothetical protein